MNLFFAKHGRAIAGALLSVAAVVITVFFGGFDRRVKSADMLSGKWTGNVVWNAASGAAYNRTLHTSVYFQPNGTMGTVMNFPTGAIGGSGTYTLQNSRLTVQCKGLSINGNPLPPSIVAGRPWYHAEETYIVTFDGTNLTLSAPAAHLHTLSAPAYPLLTTGKPIVLSRDNEPAEVKAEPAPKE